MIDWGNVPDWVAAAIAFLALLIASGAAWATIKTNQAQNKMLSMQQEQIAELRREKRILQAQRVAFWEEGEENIHIENFSDLPVHNVLVELKQAGDATWTTFPVVEVLRPTRSTGRIVAVKQRVWPEIQYATRVRICFVDASRHQWALEANGELTELDRAVHHLFVPFLEAKESRMKSATDKDQG